MAVRAKVGYVAIGVGDQDVLLGDIFYKRAADSKITVVDTAPNANPAAVPFLSKDVGGVKVGIVSFGAPRPNTAADDIALWKMRFTTLRDIRNECDILVLLDQAGAVNKDWIDRNMSRTGMPDIVVGGAGSKAQSEEVVVGRTHIMPVLAGTKDIGVVDLEVAPGQEPKIAFPTE